MILNHTKLKKIGEQSIINANAIYLFWRMKAKKLRDFFSHFIRAENNNKVLIVTSLNHTAAFFLHDGHLYFFNSNTDFTLAANGKYPEKPLGIDIDTSKDTCMMQIMDCLEDCYRLSHVAAAAADDPWGARDITMNIRAMDLIGKKMGNYSVAAPEPANLNKK